MDRPSQLNVLVDHMAKDYLQTAMNSPRHYKVCSSSWSLRIHNVPITRNIDKFLYNLVHTPSAKKYWIRKSRITNDAFNAVLWTRLGQAMDKMTLHRRFFCSKHLACFVERLTTAGLISRYVLCKMSMSMAHFDMQSAWSFNRGDSSLSPISFTSAELRDP